jgi:probable phosphoglycerate mutase
MTHDDLSGETAGNRAAVIQGQIEVPLNARGKKQADLLAEHYARIEAQFDLIYTSTMSRAVETCRRISRHQVDQMQLEPLLIERAFGDREGRPLSEYYASARQAGFADNMSQYTPEGGERIEDVGRRVRHFFADRLLPKVQANHRVLVVAHGAVIREFHRFFKSELKVDMSGLEPFKLTPNTAANQFRLLVNRRGEVVGGECIKMHDLQHMSGFDLSTVKDDASFDREACILNSRKLNQSALQQSE